LRAASIADPVRRKIVRGVMRPLLHSSRLAIEHPVSGRRLTFKAPWPDDMRAVWVELGGRLP
jgi:hypothetical protein